MQSLFSEWFWSEEMANKAARRLEREGYKTSVAYEMRADGSHDWLLQAY